MRVLFFNKHGLTNLAKEIVSTLVFDISMLATS